ncbi:hypothetical protein GCK32_018861 [Trichostrongylus colubriformis]|uniref:Uncharacterized protein n=1 Tax=Trichostrongylus colubriformis TaxID=6319 RepID=A0AAN8FNK6_TRICO
MWLFYVLPIALIITLHSGMVSSKPAATVSGSGHNGASGNDQAAPPDNKETKYSIKLNPEYHASPSSAEQRGKSLRHMSLHSTRNDFVRA